ncbi:MAG: hypothetical protein QHH26_11815 [Armatimonadota bacterium]|nr:hypothetical protein [Armatimonadota bacterium]
MRSSTTQRDKQSVNFSSNNSSNGSTRKEYSSIGKIWSSRTEKRDTSLDRERKRERTETHKYKRDDYNPYIISYSTRRFFYPNYCYTYRKDYCWPSIYFYYGTLPPYIFGPRIVFIPTFANRHICVQIPIAINWNDDYYLCDTYGRRLREALNRIQRAWERGDEYLIRDYLRFNSRIAVYLNGKYAYSIDAEDYYDMTRDAMRNIRTRSFIFDRIHKRSSDCVVAFGTHIYVDEDSGFVKTVYVSYTLERFGSDWYITEVGCSTSYPW